MAAEEQEQHVDGQLPEEPQATEEHAAPEGLEGVAGDTMMTVTMTMMTMALA